jgi:hypothetical protein
VNVRRAVLDDVAQIAALHVLAWQIGYQGLLPQPVLDGLRPEQWVPRWTATVRQAIWPGPGTLVADIDGSIVGFADLCPTR